MLTRRERDHLADSYRREPESVAGLLLACAAGLLAVIVLAMIGSVVHVF